MAEFNVEANVVPTLDNRQKRKVKEQLDGMGGSLGMSGNAGASSGLTDSLRSMSKSSAKQTGLLGGIAMTLREKLDTANKWLKINALKSGGGGGLLMNIGSWIVSALSGISLGTIGTVAVAGASLIAIFDFVDAIGVLKDRAETLKSAFNKLLDGDWSALGTLIWTGLKTAFDPAGIGEAIAISLSGWVKKKFPRISGLLGIGEGESVGTDRDTSKNPFRGRGSPTRSPRINQSNYQNRTPTINTREPVEVEMRPEVQMDEKKVADELESKVEDEVDRKLTEMKRNFQANV